MNYFTSDSHFYHENIIKYCSRPFSNVSEMNDVTIDKWNSIIKEDDIVYHLGDFCFGNESKIQEIQDRLKGKIVLINGNHDYKILKTPHLKTRFEYITPYLEMRFDKTNVVMCHFPFEVWNNGHHGSIHLHGHSHGSLPSDNQRLDVGFDVWNYQPITLQMILDKSKTLPIRTPKDHHNENTSR